MGTSWLRAAPASGPRTKEPSPKRVSIRPRPLSFCRALRTVTRLTPNWAASSFSEGSLSPLFQPPERICSRSWSKTCWLTLLLTTFLMDIVGRSFDKMVALIVTSGGLFYNLYSSAAAWAVPAWAPAILPPMAAAASAPPRMMAPPTQNTAI